MKTVAIIGAGPAGLMAAEQLSKAGHAVTIYEKMPTPARRFLMAGIGGLNLTHSDPDEELLDRYHFARWLRPAIQSFPSTQIRDWADGLGAETFIGSSGRAFPKALKASPLLRAWLARLAEQNVEILTRHEWTGWEGDALRFNTPEGERLVSADATILALGGASWPRLGSDGAWVEPVTAAGVGVNPLVPSNCGVLIRWSDILSDRYAGAPLKNIVLRCGKAQARGEVILTRDGMEGGAVYALSGAIRKALDEGEARLSLDLKPDLDMGSLIERIEKGRKGDSLSNRLRKSARIDAAAIALIREAGPLPELPEGIARRIKRHRLTVHGLAGMERAISSAGGIPPLSMNEQLMLRARPGVFAAGEMLDWDAPTGGYLLTACLASGKAAAQGVLDWLAS